MTNIYLECKTVLGNRCQFPWNWNGTQHHECLTIEGKPYCYIDENSHISNGVYFIGHICQDGCPGNHVLTVQCDYEYDNFKLCFS